MKGIWRANPNGPTWPPWEKLKNRGVTDFYVPARKIDFTTGKYVKNDLQLTPAYRSGVQSQQLGYRIYRDPSWDSIFDPSVLVEAAASDIAAVQHEGENIYVPYMFDIEYHDASFVAKTILGFRQRFPRGPLAWTLEPFQAGWFTNGLVEVLNNDINLVVVVQNFFGNMAPAGTRNGKTPRQELLDIGIAANRVKVFYDGSKPIPSGWDGCILSEERLP